MESEHFKSSELACPHCGVNGAQQALMDMLERFRAAVGRPVIIDSAYRCPEHNAAIGGVLSSQHVLGLAADISAERMTPAQMEGIAVGLGIHGIGRSDHGGYIHIDARPLLSARWCYNEAGQQCAYYPPGELPS